MSGLNELRVSKVVWGRNYRVAYARVLANITLGYDMNVKKLLTMLFSGVLLTGCSPDSLPDYPEDNAVEEGIEAFIEEIAEERLNLPDDCLKDRIDLSPGSEE